MMNKPWVLRKESLITAFMGSLFIIVILLIGNGTIAAEPNAVVASDGTHTEYVYISWDAVSPLYHYEVWRARTPTSTPVLVGKYVLATSFRDTTALPLLTYYYGVKACQTVCTNLGYDTGWKNLGTPQNVQASDGSYADKVKVTWDTVGEATYYAIYRSPSPRIDPVFVGSVYSGTSFNDTSAQPGFVYSYWARACRVTSDQPENCAAFSATDTGWRADVPNDDFATAFVIDELPYSNTQGTKGATEAADDPQPSCRDRGGNVWYRYTAAEDGLVQFQADGDYYLWMSVLTGNRGDLSEEGCSTGGMGDTAEIIIDASAGVVYYVFLGGDDGETGNLTVQVNRYNPCPAITQIPSSECEALLTFYESTNGVGDADDWFMTNTPCTNWTGVACQNGHVTKLQLEDMAISGQLPSELSDLTSLEILDLTENGNLTSYLPPSIGSLQELRQLKLGNNDFFGSIPEELGALEQLTDLELDNNRFGGNIPLELGNLIQLQTLRLDNNNLSGGLRPELANLIALRQLHVDGNPLSGPLPRELTALDLTHFSFSRTDLCEPGDPEFQDWLSTIQFLSRTGVTCSDSCVSITEISESECRALEEFYNATNGPAWGNWFSDFTPCNDWTGLTCGGGHVTRLEVNGESWEMGGSQLPPELGNLLWLTHLNLEENDLAGTIPASIANLSLLEYLNFNDNLLTGTVPNLSNLGQLQTLDLSYNQFSGVFPSSIGQLNQLRYLNLSGNNFEGQIPAWMLNLVNLEQLRIHDNELAGTIPPELANLANLEVLSLSGNLFIGTIPLELGNMVSLRNLMLDKNALEGPFPSEFANLTALVTGYSTNFGYNKLWSSDPDLIEFLDTKDPDWDQTQTVPPENLTLSPATGSDLHLTWLPIPYTADGGFYEVSYATNASGPFTVHGTTDNKMANNYMLSGLQPHTDYFVRMRSFTPAHDWQQNELWSGYSNTVSERTLGADCQNIDQIPQNECEALAALQELAPSPPLHDWFSTTTPCSWFGITCSGGHISTVQLAAQQLTGAVPPQLGNLPELIQLNLADNHLQGSFPDELAQLSELEILDLSFNELTGPLPPSFQTLSKLRELRLNNNQLEGGIPPILGLNFRDLHVLQLANNQFSGNFPDEFGGIDSLQQISLHDNLLAGPVPVSLTNLNLSTFHFHNTSLCEPTITLFHTWLNAIPDASGTEKPCPQIVVTGMEVNQVVQNWENKALLVAYKPTVVRVHVQSLGESISQASATLTGLRGGMIPPGPIPPTNPGGTIEILAGNPAPDRGQLDDSFYFQLPSNWLHGTVEMAFTLENLEYDCRESAGIDDDCLVTVTFTSGRTLELGIIDVIWHGDYGDIHVPQQEVVQDTSGIIEAMLPVPDLVISRPAPIVWQGRPGGNDEDAWDSAVALLGDINNRRAADAFTGLYYGLAVDPPSWGIMGMGYTPGSSSWGYWSSGDSTTAVEEIGHNMDRNHTACTGDEGNPDPDYPYAGGLISEVIAGDYAFWGFDLSGVHQDGPLLPPSAGDVMSYCDPDWMSDWTYQKIFDRIEDEFGTFDAVQSDSMPLQDVENDGSAVLLTGGIYPEENRAEFTTLFQLDDAVLSKLPSSGDYAIKFFGHDGQTLATFPFQPAHSPINSDLQFTLVLPFPSGAVRLALYKDQTPLDERVASDHAPTVSIVAPKGATRLSEEPTITWQGVDEDGDRLMYAVRYHPDNSTPWQTLVMDWTEQSFLLPLDFLPGSDEAQVQVLASDGFYTADDVTENLLEVPQHAPDVTIVSPQQDDFFVYDQLIHLEGSGYDTEDGQLNGESLTWSSDLDGLLGIGQTLTVSASELSPGSHVITLVAHDSSDMRSDDTTIIIVHGGRPVLPPVIAISPKAISLANAFGQNQSLSRPITIRNGGDGTISWTAESNREWITLSQYSGLAPSDLNIIIDPADLHPGTHTGQVLFSYKGKSETLVVTVAVPGHSQYLPVITMMIQPNQ